LVPGAVWKRERGGKIPVPARNRNSVGRPARSVVTILSELPRVKNDEDMILHSD